MKMLGASYGDTRRDRSRTWAMRVLVAINLSLSLSYIGLWAIAARDNLIWRADFTAYYTAWDIVRAGEGAHLYDLNTQTTYQLELLQGPSFKDDVLPYNYPPYMALGLYPLAWFSLPVAYGVFGLIQVALLVQLLCHLWAIGRTQHWSHEEQLLVAVSVCAWPPLFNTLLLGSFTLLVLLCWVNLYVTLKRDQPQRAAGWLVIATAKFQNILLYGLVLLGMRRWKTVLIALGLLSALVLVTTLSLGPSLWLDYIRLLARLSAVADQYGIVARDMINFKGLLTQSWGDDYFTLINGLNAFALAVSGAFTLWLWRTDWQPHHPLFELKLAFTLMLGLLFSPHSNVQDALLIVFPAFLFYMYLRQHALAQARVYGGLALASPVVLFIAEFLLRESLPIRLPFLLMLGLAGWMAQTLRVSQAARSLRKNG